MDKIPEQPVKVDLSASAKVSLEVKAEIPTATAGRLVDALTDLIRPWSESRGLKADLIRLHREEVAFEIARRAAETARLAGAKPEPIPLKILIPLLEKGSQEAADDDFMIDLWANLLASSASGKDVQPRFVGIIGELGGSQARLLRHIHSGKKNGAYNVHQQHFLNMMDEALRNVPVLSAKELGDTLYELVDHNGSYLLYCQISEPRQGGQLLEWYEPRFENKGPMLLETDLEILASLGLLERVNIYRDIGQPHIDSVAIAYYHTTFLADDFLAAVTFDPRAAAMDAELDAALDAEPNGDGQK
jgi:hypothetical protein